MERPQTETKTPRGARLITSELRRAIESGVYLDGEQLPSERELSITYASSRSTIRKVLENLEEAELVTRKAGSGTFINYPQPPEDNVEAVIAKISPLQLIEARVGFERQMTRLAVVHATANDLENMEKVLAKLEKAENQKDEFTKLDSEFHLLLANASGNPLIYQLYMRINEVRTHSQWKAAREIVLEPAKIRQYNKYHREILDALIKRDTAAAINALNGHMDLAQQDLLGTEHDDSDGEY